MNKTLRNLALVALVAAPVSAFAEIQGAGTAADPYQIATADDLTNACSKVLAAPGTTVYFVQTADIDMAGVKNYLAVNGTYGDYTNSIVYDGQNHVIKNFAPDYVADGGAQGYYNGSIFGVLTGKVMNLGVVDADVDMKGENKTAGILGAYFGHGSVVDPEYKTSCVENVYVTGKIKAGSYNTGGMFGTTGSAVEMKNCFAIVEYSGTGTRQGGIIGRVSNEMTIENSYVAGTVAGVGANVGLVAGEITSSGSLAVDGVVVFNTGAEKAVGTGAAVGEFTMANTAATEADGLEEVKGWDAFSATETIDGYPALEYTLAGEGTEANPYIIDGQTALCNAYRFVDGTKTGITYFVQTADVDMAGVELYHPIVGWNGSYAASINYDGQNHVIKNFAPVEPEALGGGGAEAVAAPYYSNTIFGVLSGTLKNLAVIDADCTQKLQGIGILGAYVGHGNATATPTNTIENVFVSGMVTCEKDGTYAGGMFGTTATPTTVTNCFANVDLVIADATTIGGGLIGRVSNDSEFTCVYTAGTVSGEKAFLISNTNKTPTIIADGVIAFNTGATEAFASAIKVEGDVEVADEDTKADLIEEVKAWEAFSATKELAGYPILKAFEAYGDEAGQSGIFDAAVEEGADAPAVYYNLQGVQVANPENGVYIVRRGSKVTKELIRK